MPLFPRLIALSTVALLSACSSANYYTAPVYADTVSGWSVLPALKTDRVASTDVDVSNEEWWVTFRDPYMDKLVRQALRENNALKAAMARVDQADADTVFAHGQLMPLINGTGSVSRGRSGPDNGDVGRSSQLGVQGSWELDPAGGNRRRLEAAQAAADAARADRDRIRAAVVADTAINYIRLVGARRQYELARVNLQAQGDSLQVTEGQREAGQISDLEVVRARAQVETTRARLPQLETEITAFTNELSVLTGMKPGTLDSVPVTQRQIPTVPSKVVVSTPVAAIAQRPDIRVAERQLARDAALKEAASAQLFPSLSLSAFFGIGDSSGAASFHPWNIAAGTLAPILNFGRIKSQINNADARQKESYFNYHETVLRGLSEVENALTAYVNEQTRMRSLSSAAKNQSRTREIAAEQFKAGTIDQLDLLVAEQARLDADIALAQSQTQAAENLVLLYRALGWGGLADQGAAPQVQTEEKTMAPGKMQPVVDE